MDNLRNAKNTQFSKEIFRTGEYIQHFSPDDEQNPFREIYDQKKKDTIGLISISKGPKTILDVGGGMGRLSLSLAKSKENHVFLADISFDMLKLATKNTLKLRNLMLANLDANKLPFNDNSFDYVVGLDLLCHLEKPEGALREFHRVLKNQGFLIMDSTNSNPFWAFFYPGYLGKNPLTWIKIIRFKGVYPGWEAIVNHYSKKKFLFLLREMGFKVIQNLNYGPIICPKWHLAISKKRT